MELETEPQAAEKADTEVIERDHLEHQRLLDLKTGFERRVESEKRLVQEIEKADSDAEYHKKQAKKAKERGDIAKAALIKLASGEANAEIGDFEDEDDGQARINWDKGCDAIKSKLDAGEVIWIKDMDWNAVHRSALSELLSTGKPPKVKPVEIFGNKFICTDVQPTADGKRAAIMHQLYDAESWDQHYPNTQRMDFPNQDRPESLAFLGEHAGKPVKIGRKLVWIGADKDVMSVGIPDDAKIGGEEAAPTDEGEGDEGPTHDLGIVSNRILAEVEGQSLTVGTLGERIGVPGHVIVSAADQHPELALIKEGDDSALWTVSR